MELSVVGIHPCPAPMANTPVNAARLTKIHLGFPPASFSFPGGSVVGRRTVQHIPCPITCTLDGDSFFLKKNGSENGNSRSKVGACLALACALGIISCSGMMHHHKAFASPSTASSLTMEKVARTSIEVKTALDLLMHSRGADEAEKYLRKTIKAYDEDLEAGYRARVALIEVLMHRGKYKEAAELCHLIRENKNYNHLLEKDRKLHLIQVFIYGMLNDGKKAKQFWKKFKNANEAERE